MTDYLQLRSGVVVPLDYAETLPPAELAEIATTADGRDITRGFVDQNPILESQDTVLRERGGGNLKIYEEIRRDDQVKAVFEQRRMAVISKEWEVTPGDDTPRAKEAADFLEEQLDRISFDRVTEKMLWGTFYGYAVGECLWAVEDNRIVLDAIKVRRSRRFGFAPDFSLRLKTSKQPFGETLPERKFWHFSCGADNDDDPYGLGLAHWLYWPVFFKRNGIKFWLFFLEKFGQPTAKGTYPVNAQREERNRLLQALQAISTDTGITVPEGMQIELLEAARSGTGDYTHLYDRMDAAIAKVIIGHTGSSDATPGRLGGEDNAMDVRDDIVKADADLVCESFNQTVVKWLIEWNFGVDVAAPEVWRVVTEPDDLNKLAERDKLLGEIGYRPTLKRIKDVYGPEYEPAPVPSSPFQANFAEGDNQEPSDLLADNLETATQEILDKMMVPVRRLVMSAGSLEDIRDGLNELYPDMNEREFATVLREALAAAILSGRVETEEEQDG